MHTYNLKSVLVAIGDTIGAVMLTVLSGTRKGLQSRQGHGQGWRGVFTDDRFGGRDAISCDRRPGQIQIQLTLISGAHASRSH